MHMRNMGCHLHYRMGLQVLCTQQTSDPWRQQEGAQNSCRFRTPGGVVMAAEREPMQHVLWGV